MQAIAGATRVQLPVRAAMSRARTQGAAVRCMAQQRPQQRPQQRQSSEVAAASAALALNTLLLSRPALAEEMEAAAADAAAASSGFAPLGVTPAGWALVVSPVVFYALFNLYRSQVDPRAKFGDAIFIFAASLIGANILSILVLKVRIF